MPHSVKNQTGDVSWSTLYRIGSVAALIAVIVFRRNFDASEKRSKKSDF
jgi:hypothetical protein